MLSFFEYYFPGHIPSPLLKSVAAGMTVNMLQGNIFDCGSNNDINELPLKDQGIAIDQYSCGSNSFNDSVFAFIAVLGVALLTGAFLYWANKIQFFGLLDYGIEDIRKVVPNVEHFLALVKKIGQFFVCSAGFMITVLLPLFCALSVHYRTHDYEYSWLPSTAFLSGYNAGIILFVFFTVFGLYVGLCADIFIFDGDVKDAEERSNSCMEMCKKVAFDFYFAIRLFIIGIINCVALLCVNVLYIEAVATVNNTELQFCAIALSIFKLGWNSVVLPQMMKRTAWNVDDSRHLEAEQTFTGFMIVFNTILCPILATGFEDPQCFQNVVKNPSTIPISIAFAGSCGDFAATDTISSIGGIPVSIAAGNDFYSGSYYGYSLPQNVVTRTSECLLQTSFSKSSTFQPPFLYGYQCSSIILTNYAPVFVFSSITSSFVTPTIYLLLGWACKYLFDKCVVKDPSTIEVDNSGDQTCCTRLGSLLFRGLSGAIPPILQHIDVVEFKCKEAVDALLEIHPDLKTDLEGAAAAAASFDDGRNAHGQPSALDPIDMKLKRTFIFFDKGAFTVRFHRLHGDIFHLRSHFPHTWNCDGFVHCYRAQVHSSNNADFCLYSGGKSIK